MSQTFDLYYPPDKIYNNLVDHVKTCARFRFEWVDQMTRRRLPRMMINSLYCAALVSVLDHNMPDLSVNAKARA